MPRLFDATRPPDHPRLRNAGDHTKRLEQMLGYCYSLQDLAPAHISLSLCAHPVLVSQFISYKCMRGERRAPVQAAALTLSHACKWLQACSPAWSGRAHQRHLVRMLLWLKGLHAQLGSNFAERPSERDPEALRGEGRWMPAGQLAARVEQVRLDALDAIERQREGTSELPDVVVASRVQAALVCGLAFGGMGSLRPDSVIATLQGPWAQGCSHPDCQHPATCPGNSVVQPEDGASSSWQLVLTHHKTAGRGSGDVLRVTVPAELTPLLDYHCQPYLGGHEVLVQREPGQPAVPWLLVNPAAPGSRLGGAGAARVWASCMPQGCRVTMQQARSILATAYRAQGDARHERGVAALMGNSSRMWDERYDRGARSRRAQEALAGLAAFRAALLRDQQQQDRVAALTGGDSSSSSSSEEGDDGDDDDSSSGGEDDGLLAADQQEEGAGDESGGALTSGGSDDQQLDGSSQEDDPARDGSSSEDDVSGEQQQQQMAGGGAGHGRDLDWWLPTPPAWPAAAGGEHMGWQDGSDWDSM